MFVVTLKDGTTYNIDTDSSFNARCVVEYKLKNRLDHRQIATVSKIEGCRMDKTSKYYNSGDAYDGKELICTSGWSYRWL